MRRKLVLLAFLLTAIVTASDAKADLKNVCLNCGYCIANMCYDCIVVAC